MSNSSASGNGSGSGDADFGDKGTENMDEIPQSDSIPIPQIICVELLRKISLASPNPNSATLTLSAPFKFSGSSTLIPNSNKGPTSLSLCQPQGLTEPGLSELCRLIILTAQHCTNNPLVRVEIKQFLRKLAIIHPKTGIIWTKVLLENWEGRKVLNITKVTSKSALQSLKWLFLVHKINYSPSSEFTNLLALLINQIQEKSLEKSVGEHLSSFLKSLSHEDVQKLISSLLADEPKSGVSLSFYLIPIGLILTKTDWDCSGDKETKDKILNQYLKSCVMTKEKQSSWTLESLSKYLLPIVVTNENFTGSLLPTVQKAMLRSPETAIEALAYTLKGTSGIELSESNGLDFGKMLATCLHLQDDGSREHGIFASEILAKRIQSGPTLQAILQIYFNVLHGSEGKLTVASHKLSILKAIKLMSFGLTNIPTPQLIPVAQWIHSICIKSIETEVHEGTLIEYFSVISAWSDVLGTASSPALLTFIPKGLTTLKGPVKLAFGQALVSTFSPDSRSASLIPSLEPIVRALENLGSHIHQGSNLAESIPLAILIMSLKLSTPECLPPLITDSICTLIRSLLSHVDTRLIESTQSSSCTVQQISILAEKLIGENYEKIGPGVFDSLALSLTVKDYKVRAKCRESVHRLLLQLSGFKICRDLIGGLERTVELGHETGSSGVSSHIREETLRFLSSTCSKVLSGLDLDTIGMDLIPLAHSTTIRPYYWINLVQTLGLRPEKILQKYWKSSLRSKYLESDSIILGTNGTGKNNLKYKILSTFSLVYGEVVIPNLVDEFLRSSKDPKLRKVSRDEYFIFRTPEGQLYDTSVLETGENTVKNMKRESKAYSYKEQLEEINLRRELEKQKLLATGKPPKFTPKQIESMKIQLDKEDSVRRQIRELDKIFYNGIQCLESGLIGNPYIFGHFIKNFILELVDVIGGSHVAAPAGVKFYEKLANQLFNFNLILGNQVTQSSLRLISPKCDINQEWGTLPLVTSITKTFKSLHIQSLNLPLPSPTFTFTFPLFQQSLRTLGSKLGGDGITCFLDTTISTLKARNSESELADYSPELLPRKDLCALLYWILGTCTVKTQQQSVVSVLLELAKSGTEIKLDLDEVDIHLEGLGSHLSISRDISLRSLSLLWPTIRKSSWGGEIEDSFRGKLYQSTFDPTSEVADLASKIWKTYGFETNWNLSKTLLIGIVHPVEEMRVSGARGLGSLISNYPTEISSLVQNLMGIYDEYSIQTPPVTDDFGRILEEGIDKWEGRQGVGLTLKEISPFLTQKSATSVMNWLISSALWDSESSVHHVMLEASVEIVQTHGKECLDSFTQIIQSYLDLPESAAPNDNVRQACVVLMGCLARHIDPSDPRVRSIFSTLIETLSTPSEKVQEAVANCLPALVPAIPDSPKVINLLIKKLVESEKYGVRRGAAYGLAGMIKGLGILSLKQYDIMNVLAEAMQDKKNYRRREGALMALELLCEFLGRLFEPYIVHVLPYLLQCLGDSNQYVREATENTARAVMSRLSAHGVKLVLPALLTALNEDSWRTKCGSVDLLGRMAYCAPKQLSGCLPMIVPHLIEVLGDSHVKVQEAAAKALGLIGSVIRNPEIQSVVPILLDALQDPSKKASSCLQSLLKTEFVHFVDSPSLALIMPVVERAFNDRSTENRRMAAQIIGNMYSLTDHSDLAPYMNNVMPGLKASLLDPVPEVRGVAAKALGAMAKGMGEKCYDELLPWLMKMLVSESNSVDRSGAAQGLAEVIGALGEDKLQKFMPEIIRKADSDDLAPHVRDGYMMMFIYMPSVFEDAFIPFIGQITNPILKALADENEYVRETALRAGQRIVTGFADTAIELLLPELERGIFDENWRIRFSSIQLLGDLLYKISGVSGKMSTESASDDDNFGTENSQKMIIKTLGLERRNQVLAGLYMGRSDVALMVRQAALHVWKVVVANTPKTLRELLPTLFSLLLGHLASNSQDKRQVAARTLGDLVRKLGEKILPEIIPILERGLDSPRSDERQGVCIGLSEIMSSTSRDMVLAFVDNLVPTLRKALCDPCPGVRGAAAQTFSSLHSTVGSKALDEILPFMMRRLNDPIEGEFALDGLGQVLQVKSKAVMPYLIPQLTSPPINTKALASLSSVAGDALAKHLGRILPALMTVLKDSAGCPEWDDELFNCQQVVLAVSDEAGVRTLLDELLDGLKSEFPEVRRGAMILLSLFCVNTKVDLHESIPGLLRAMVLQMTTGGDEVILKSAADILTAILKSLDSDSQIALVEDVRQAMRFAKGDLKDRKDKESGSPTSLTLPGFCLPKSVKPLLGIFREALLNAPAEIKEQAALGMGELIELSSTEALKPSVIHVTGPLIRILGDRYGPDLKVAVIDTLCLLLPKVGTHLRAFLPQLQTTFQKASNDPQTKVRLKAEFALTQLSLVSGSSGTKA